MKIFNKVSACQSVDVLCHSRLQVRLLIQSRDVDAWPGEGGGRGRVRGIPFLRWSGVRAIMRPAFGHEFVLDTVLADEEWTRLRGGLSASGPFILVSARRRR